MDKIKIINNFIEEEDAIFLIDWIDKNSHKDNLFRKRIGVAFNEGIALRAVFPDEKAPNLFKDLENVINKYSKKFIKFLNDEYNLKENLYFYGVSITKLSEGIQLRMHQDIHNSFASLNWSCVIYLNEDYFGGEVAFVNDFNQKEFISSEYDSNFYLYSDKNNGFVFKPRSFDAVVFPANQWHGGKKINSGTKYAIILWSVKEKEYEFEGFESERIWDNAK